MACPAYSQLDRDEAVIESALAERHETLRYTLPDEGRAVEVEGSELAALFQLIIERRAERGLAVRLSPCGTAKPLSLRLRVRPCGRIPRSREDPYAACLRLRVGARISRAMGGAG